MKTTTGRESQQRRLSQMTYKRYIWRAMSEIDNLADKCDQLAVHRSAKGM